MLVTIIAANTNLTIQPTSIKVEPESQGRSKKVNEEFNVKDIAAEILGRNSEGIENSPIPIRYYFFSEFHQRTQGKFAHAYTGELKTIGELVEVLTAFAADQKK